ncbi:MAG: hypothetical protein JSS16_12205 [Proteobacteria bacterium]|nr:hypothetical protein [Pseudomonadota bacterium]
MKAFNRFTWPLVAIAASGCAPQTTIKLDASSSKVEPSYVRDETLADHYPSFVAGEGNIYSCRYGIHAYAKNEFNPPKNEMFARLLAKEKPSMVSRDVRLKRFDVYRNYRVRLLKAAGHSIGGVVVPDQAQKLEAQQNPNAPALTFSLQQNPGNGRGSATENQIGCDGVSEGEYFPSQVAPENDAIVIWLSFTIDGIPYEFRSMLQFGYVSSAANDRAVSYAIDETLQAVAKKLSD